MYLLKYRLKIKYRQIQLMSHLHICIAFLNTKAQTMLALISKDNLCVQVHYLFMCTKIPKALSNLPLKG